MLWQLSAQLVPDIQRHFKVPVCGTAVGVCFGLFFYEAAVRCSGMRSVLTDSFPSALNWWLQIIVLLMYTLFYLNFYSIFKCIYDSIVADRSIFGKGIFFCLLLLWFTGCNYILYILYDFAIYHINKLIIFLKFPSLSSKATTFLTILLPF